MGIVRRYGIVAAALVVVGATIAAYLGGLPGFFRGDYADKVLHFLLFGMLAFFWVMRWGDGRIRLGRLRLPTAVVVPLFLGAAEEAAQALSPLRNADWVDLLCDLLGLVSFWWLGCLLAGRDGTTER